MSMKKGLKMEESTSYFQRNQDFIEQNSSFVNDFAGFVKQEPLDEDFKNQLFEDANQYADFSEVADPFNSVSLPMWSLLVNRTLFLSKYQEGNRTQYLSQAAVTKLLIKEVNELLTNVIKFFQECCVPVCKEEKSDLESLEIDGPLIHCLPCHPQNPRCFYNLKRDIPQVYSDTLFNPSTNEFEYNNFDSENYGLLPLAPDIDIDIKQEVKDNSSVDKKVNIDGKKKRIRLPKDFVCDHCGKVFKTKDSMKMHVTVKHEKKKIFKCKKCSKAYSYRRGLIEHREKCTGPTNENRWIFWGKDSNNPRCIHPDCIGKEEQTFKVLEIMKHIMEVHTTPENSHLQCPDCPKKFPMKIVLKHHREQEHQAKWKVCSICGTSVTRMKVHMRLMHSLEKKFQCDKCDFQCKLKNQLTRHSASVHEDPEDRKYKCHICTKGFLSTQKLNEHILTHAKIKPYKCEFCNQAFSNFSGHRQHMMKKHGLKFTCDACGFDSASMRGLSIHKRDKHGIT